jgi:hypothetical protein
MSEQTVASKFFERALVGTIDAIARAGAKAFESLAGDARKALKNEALKAEMLEEGIKAWRLSTVGEVQDIPASLQDDGEKSEQEGVKK